MTKLEMTSGSIPKKLLLFSLPMILGSFFQLTYATIDGIVIGRYVGKSALAAVGAATPLYNILIFLLVGLCNGASILMAEFYGAKKMRTLKQNIGTSLSAGVIFSLLLTVICFFSAAFILKVSGVKPELRSAATEYLSIVALGLVFSFIYNLYAVALRSTGDSLRPLYFLIISSLVNIGLDFLFVAGWHWGVRGAAWATVISQITAALAAAFYAARVDTLFRFRLSELKIVGRQLSETCRYAVASALQQIVLFVGKSLVQININSLSIDAQAAFAATGKIDDYVITPIQGFGNSAAVFISQNRGSGHPERCKRGLGTGLVFSLLYACVIAVVIYFLQEPLIKVFLDPSEETAGVILEGCTYFSLMVFFYVFPALTNSVQSYFRGLGTLSIVFYSTSVQIVFRVATSFILIPKLEIAGAAICSALGWTAMLAFEVPLLIYYLKTKKGLDRVSRIDIVETE